MRNLPISESEEAAKDEEEEEEEAAKDEEEEAAKEEELISVAPVNQVFESDRDLGELGSEKKDDDE